MAHLPLTWPSVFVALILVVVTLGCQSSLPNAYAKTVCQVQITNVEYTSSVSSNQTFDIKAHLMITCVPVNENVLVRVDVNSLDSNRTLSTNSLGIGPIEVANAPFVKIVNVTITNTIQAPPSAGNLKLQVVAWVFAGTALQGSAELPIQVQVGKPPAQLITTTATQISTPSFSTFGVLELVLALSLIGSMIVLMRRRRQQMAVSRQEVVEKETQAEPTQATPAYDVEQNISTGYPQLDAILGGGLPVDYAILMASPPCDERDLLFRKIIESSLSIGCPVCFLSRDLGRTQDFATRYRKDFYVFSPQADNIASETGNVFKIPSVQYLIELNLSFARAMETLPKTSSSKLIIIDILSDVLLEHKALTTRKWLDDFIAKRKAEGFTILGVLNPMISSEQESQTIIDLFDGIIEIYQREVGGRTRRFLSVKKMYGRKYAETELMLDKDKLF
jgi:hypothetical protein